MKENPLTLHPNEDPLKWAAKHGIPTDWRKYRTCPGCQSPRKTVPFYSYGHAGVRFTCDCGYKRDSMVMVTATERAFQSWQEVLK